VTTRISQFHFSFYRNRPVQFDFSGGQITSDAGLLPLRAFDERHHLTSTGPHFSAIREMINACAMICWAAAAHISDRGRLRGRE
jgi:hypothetical protein